MKRTEVVIVGGCGHVGLPLGIVIASQPGFQVVCLDVDKTKIAQVNSGSMPFIEEGMEPILKKIVGKSLIASDDSSCLRTADVVVTVIGTPVDRHLNPSLHELYNHVDATINAMPDDSLLILRSTLYPGTSKLVYERIKFLKRKIHLAVGPERIAEGKALEEISQLPQIVGAFEPAALERAKEFFSSFCSSIIAVEPLEAELGKLFVNSWRYLNFAVSNQFYILCQRSGLDFYRIYDAFKQNYPRMSSFPRAGLTAGPCLLKDTLQLAAYSNNLFAMGHPAMIVNESMPNVIIEGLQKEHNLAERTVAVLGMAFKGDIDDGRDSLAYKLKNLLCVYAKAVYCSDPYVKDDRLVPVEIAIDSADIIILGCPHSVYRHLQLPADKIVIDIWGFWRQNVDDEIKQTSLPDAATSQRCAT